MRLWLFVCGVLGHAGCVLHYTHTIKEWDDFLLAAQEAVRKAERKLAKIRKSTAKTKARQAAKKWGKQAAKTKAAKLVLAAKQQDSKGKPPDEDLNIEERGCKCVRADTFT